MVDCDRRGRLRGNAECRREVRFVRHVSMFSRSSEHGGRIPGSGVGGWALAVQTGRVCRGTISPVQPPGCTSSWCSRFLPRSRGTRGADSRPAPRSSPGTSCPTPRHLADISVVGRGALGLIFVYVHFTLLAGVAAFGEGTKLAVVQAVQPGLSAGARWALAGGVCAFRVVAGAAPHRRRMEVASRPHVPWADLARCADSAPRGGRWRHRAARLCRAHRRCCSWTTDPRGVHRSSRDGNHLGATGCQTGTSTQPIRSTVLLDPADRGLML
jgi:hypothetical protein